MTTPARKNAQELREKINVLESSLVLARACVSLHEHPAWEAYIQSLRGHRQRNLEEMAVAETHDAVRFLQASARHFSILALVNTMTTPAHLEGMETALQGLREQLRMMQDAGLAPRPGAGDKKQ